jgi:hypothetical protein
MKTIPPLTRRTYRNLGDMTTNVIVAGPVSMASQGTLSPAACSALAASNPATPTTQVNGFTLPATGQAVVAGYKSMLAQLQAELAANTITQDQFNSAVATLASYVIPPSPAQNVAAAQAAAVATATAASPAGIAPAPAAIQQAFTAAAQQATIPSGSSYQGGDYTANATTFSDVSDSSDSDRGA